MQLSKNTAEVLNKIRSGKVGRDEVITSLYNDQNLKSKVYNQVLKRGGNINDAQSVFNLCLVQFFKTVTKNRSLTIDINLEAYIIAIAKNVWFQELRKNAKTMTTEINDNLDVSEENNSESLLLNIEKMDLLSDLLSKLKRRCKDVLMYWANGYSMEEIAQMCDYKSAMMARKKKYQCMKELIEYVSKNPHIRSAIS